MAFDLAVVLRGNASDIRGLAVELLLRLWVRLRQEDTARHRRNTDSVLWTFAMEDSVAGDDVYQRARRRFRRDGRLTSLTALRRGAPNQPHQRKAANDP